ncbi:hypothetical protein Tco_1136316 [Tanacetum coccineum]
MKNWLGKFKKSGKQKKKETRLLKKQQQMKLSLKTLMIFIARVLKADRFLLKHSQEQEREQFSIEERAKFLHDTIAAQRKFPYKKIPPKKKISIRNLKLKSRKRINEKRTQEEKASSTRKKMKSRKRRFKQDTSQDDPSDTEKENEELKLCLTIAPDEDKEVDYEILDKEVSNH